MAYTVGWMFIVVRVIVLVCPVDEALEDEGILIVDLDLSFLLLL